MKAKDILRKRRHTKIRAKLSGTATRPRLVVFRSLNTTYAHLIDDEASKTLITVSDLKKKGEKSENAKAVGEEIAKKALELKVKECVFDRNGYKYHGRVKALAEGAREGGLKF
jgi:large subunit ribosomal protein L18